MKTLEKDGRGGVSRALQRAAKARLWAPSDHLLLAVSGGADSVALLHACARERESLEIGAITVATIDHGLRSTAREEVECVREHAERHDLPFHDRRVELPPEKEAGGLQAAARQARRRMLEEIRDSVSAAAIVTAHTATDQAETVLLRALRGTSLSGLAAIRPRRDRWLRPLLECRREELRAYCEGHGLAFHDDPSNEDPRFDRSLVRHELLPLIEDRLNPRAVEALARLAELCAGDEALLGELAGTLRREASREDPAHGEVLLGETLLSAPPPLARRVLVEVWRSTGDEGLRPEAAFVEEILERLARGGQQLPWERSLPGGVTVTLQGGILRFSRTRPRS